MPFDQRWKVTRNLEVDIAVAKLGQYRRWKLAWSRTSDCRQRLSWYIHPSTTTIKFGGSAYGSQQRTSVDCPYCTGRHPTCTLRARTSTILPLPLFVTHQLAIIPPRQVVEELLLHISDPTTADKLYTGAVRLLARFTRRRNTVMSTPELALVRLMTWTVSSVVSLLRKRTDTSRDTRYRHIGRPSGTV